MKAVIFDMGGTLLHYAPPGSAPWRDLETPGIRSLYRYLREQGHAIATHEDEFIETMFGRLADGWEQATGGHLNLSARDWIRAGVADHALTLDDASLQAAAHRFAQPLRANVRAANNAKQVLAALRERGLRIGLISNTIWPAELHLQDLDATGLLQYLDYTLFSGEYGMWKPQPGIFQHMLSVLGVAPNEALFVGDSPQEDIRGAQQVGMRAVWVRNTEFLLNDVQPDAIIDELGELLTWHDATSTILFHWRT